MKKLNTKTLSLLTLLIAFCSGEIRAQFNTIVPMLPTKEALVISTDGTEVTGKVVSSFIISGQLKSLTIKDTSGVKHKFKAAEVSEVRAKLTNFAKLAAISEANEANGRKHKQFKAIINATKHDLWKKELVIFYQVELSPGKFSLLQLLNPGSNTIVSVYPAPMPQDSDIQYYYAVKGDEVTKVVYNKYVKDIYAKLFGDCEAFISKNPIDKKLEMQDFPKHVTVYNQTCGPK